MNETDETGATGNNGNGQAGSGAAGGFSKFSAMAYIVAGAALALIVGAIVFKKRVSFNFEISMYLLES
jgi:hypothetical protein